MDSLTLAMQIERRSEMASDAQDQKSDKVEGYGANLQCEDNWAWDPKHQSHKVMLFGNPPRIAKFHPNWSSGTGGVRGNKVLNNGRYYWEILLPRRIFGTSMMFGIGTKKAKLHEDSFVNLLGIDSQSWGLSHKGMIWHNHNWTYYTRPFRENVTTRVGILFDGVVGTLTYFKDGKCLGVAFKGLNKVKEPLYPMISSTAAKTEMVLENTRRDFVNLQDRCRVVIARRMRSKKDVAKLCLPPRMQTYLSEIIDEHYIDSYKLVNQTIDYLEMNFLTSIPGDQDGL